MKARLRSLLAWRPGKLAQGTLAMTAGLGLRTLGQGVVFLLVARVLGVEAYGAYSAVLALAMAFCWFAGLGASGIMLRDTARNAETFAESWGRTLAALLVTAPPLLVIYLLLAWALLPNGIAWGVILCFGVAEILFAPLTLAAVQAYQGHERIGRAARMTLAPVLPRVVAAMFLLPLYFALSSPARLLLVWALTYLFAATISVGYVLWLLRRDFKLNFAIHWRGLAPTMREGWPYSLGNASGKVYVDIDKLMLVRLAGLEAAGVYAAAYRIVDMAGIPLMSFLAVVAPRLFRAGRGGVFGSFRYALSVLPLPMAYAAAVSIGLYLLAGIVPWLLGPSFQLAVEALRWLAWLPLVALPRLLMQQVLIGADRQRIWAGILTAGALLNIVLNLWSIPRWGWRGAVGATYVSELGMMGLMLIVLVRSTRHASP